MNKTIHPIILFSTSSKTNSVFEVIKENYKEMNTAHLIERYFRHISLDQNFQLENSNDKEILKISIDPSRNKAENLKGMNDMRNDYVTHFTKSLGSLSSLENSHFASDKGLNISTPQIIILGEADSPLLLPLILPLLQSPELMGNDFSRRPSVHLVLRYNTKIQGGLSNNESVIYKNALLKEIETFELEFHPYVWLLDIINELSINLEDEETLNNAIVQLVDLLYNNASNLTSSVYNNELFDGKPCLYSTFGFANVFLPKEKIRNYLTKHAISSQLGSLVESFGSKHELISVKDEIIRFSKEIEFDRLNEKLSINDGGDQIFPPFSFNTQKYIAAEQEIALNKQLSPIEEFATIAATSTSDFFHNIDLAEKEYAERNQLNFSQQLDLSKKRETDKLKNAIKTKQAELMDSHGKGINFSQLFVSVLANNKAVFDSLIDGRFTSDIPNLDSSRENIRSLFTGDEIKLAQNQVSEYTDKLSNNNKLIQQYSTEKAQALESIEQLKVSSGDSNPKIMELSAKVQNYEEQILKLSNEVNELSKGISDQTRFIESRKNEFDQDPTKEKFKILRKESIKASLAEIKDVKIPELDRALTIDYEQKNVFIEQRKKFIFYKLMIVPALLAVFLILSSTFLYQKVHEDLNMFWKSIIGSLAILVIYYVVMLIKFSKLKKTFEELIAQISQRLQLKSSYMLDYQSNINKLYNADFEFERDLIAFNMFGPMISWTNMLQDEITLFKEKIVESFNAAKDETEGYSFESNPFEFSVVNKNEIDNIYDSSKIEIFNTNNNDRIKISDCFTEFEKTKTLEKLLEPVHATVSELDERKFKTESLRSILLNKSKLFEGKNTSGFFQKLIQTSRPLLRTEKRTSDVPYTQDIIFGFNDDEYSQYLSGIKLNTSISMQEQNEDRFGLISIKSNFPAFLIYDISNSENVVSENVTSSNSSIYFSNNESFTYSLIPDENSSSPDSIDNSVLSESLIFSIARENIRFDDSKNCFYHEELGELGKSWDELIKSFNSKRCAHFRKESEEKYNTMLNVFEEKDYVEMASRFKSALLSTKFTISKSFEEALSVFFFSILHGVESDWIEVANYFKELTKKSI